jgi:uncharacterized phage protein gp47/JayE
MAIRGLSDIIDSAVEFIQSKIPALSLLQGTVARDVVVESPSQEFQLVYQETGRTQKLQTLSDPTAFEGTELDDLAASVGLTRLSGTAATVDITLSVPTLTSDITVVVGTQVSTSPTVLTPSVVSFVTLTTAQFVAVNAGTYFNPITGLYELEIPAQAISIGVAGNVATATINTIVTSISGAPSITVTNTLAAAGGSNSEANESLIERIKVKQTGNNVGTNNGILGVISGNSLVVDSLLVKPGDPELLRNQFGNAVDAVILGGQLQQVAEPHVFITGQYDIPLSRQPASAVSVVSGLVSSTPYVFILNTDYTVTIDYTSLFQGTPRALSKITFLPLGTLPDNESVVTITYSYNKLIQDLQAVMDSDGVKIVGSDLLVKEATEVLIQIGATIESFAGFTHTDVADDVVTNLTAFLNGLELHEDADESVIISVIQGTEGVVEVIPGSLNIAAKRPADPGFITVSDVEIKRTEYGRPDVITII